MSLSSAIFAHAADLDEKAFAGISRAEMVASLLSWLDCWAAQEGWIDPEPICDAGILVGRSGYDGLDEEVWNWRREEPASARHEIAADFLWGYWRTARRPSAGTVKELIAALNDLPREHWVFAASLFALYAIHGWGEERVPSELGERIEEILERELHQLETAGLHPGLVATLRHVNVRVRA